MTTQQKIAAVEQLEAIAKAVERVRSTFEFQVMICTGTSCQASESHFIKSALCQAIDKQQLSSKVLVVETGCMGFCAAGPLLRVFPGDYFYQALSLADIPEIVTSHFIERKPVSRLMYVDPVTQQRIETFSEIPFLKSQTLLVLKNRGLINPEKIEDYIWRGGYRALAKALTQMNSNQIIGEVKESGLRGRGGAGFPTGLKWELCANVSNETKYVLCNADEGDPGAFMDRSVLESDPHSVLEGMIIAGKAINAHHGFIYCRAEYPIAIQRLQIAIQQAEERGLLGSNIFNSGFGFEIEIYRGAGAFVCGEETALMKSIEGKRGMPRPRPPFPAISGLWEKPTILNNVETFSNIPHIITSGGGHFAEIGTGSATGTKIFSLTGNVNNIGLVEVPMGTKLGDIVFDIGGGIAKGKKYKAAQLGGPSGGCLPAEHLNTPVDYENITRAGAIMGSGGLIVMDENTCMVDMARFFIGFCQDESCGKCTPCRIGTKRMQQILERICHGEGQEGDIELLEKIAASIKDTALCGLGQTAPNPVLSTIRYFRHEYEAHIRDKHCTAVVCTGLFQSPCQHACPVGMDVPAYMALVRAERLTDAYKILKRTNPFPAICGRVCGHPCQDKCRRSQLDEPLAIKHIKRFVADNVDVAKTELIPVIRKEKIAVIGAGPSGLTAALELKKRGYAVTVFESLPEAGGMLRWGIPGYRLPREILSAEIQSIQDTGVEIRTGTTIGVDLSVDRIKQDYQAIYLAVGAAKSARLNIPGEDSKGVFGAIELLRAVNLKQAIPFGKKVAVIGGGNSAIDAARTAVREGANSVTVYYRRERKDMPCLPEEIHAAEQEGVKLELLCAPKTIKQKAGQVCGLELTKMRLGEFDRSGRRKAVAIENSEFTAKVDMVISAVGQVNDLSFLEKTGIEIATSKQQGTRIKQTSDPFVWAGGDVVTGPAMVIDAIRAGQLAAAAIDRQLLKLNGEKPWIAKEESIEIPLVFDEEPTEQRQTGIHELNPKERRHNYQEVERGYTVEMALLEASRCLRCDGRSGLI